MSFEPTHRSARKDAEPADDIPDYAAEGLDQFGNDAVHPEKTLFRNPVWINIDDKLGPGAPIDDLMRFRRLIRNRYLTSPERGFIAAIPGRYPYFFFGLMIAACWGPGFAVTVLERSEHVNNQDAGSTMLSVLTIVIALIGLSMMTCQWWGRHDNGFLASKDHLLLQPHRRRPTRIPMSSITHTAIGSAVTIDRDGDRLSSPFTVISYRDSGGLPQSFSWWGIGQPAKFVFLMRHDLKHRVAGPGEQPQGSHWSIGVLLVAFAIATFLVGALAIQALLER